MKKSLALVLALMMILSMFTMGISVSAADMPAGAIAISNAEGLAAMESGKYYYLTADITLGSPTIKEEQAEPSTTPPAAIESAEEADRITIPAGATLDGNGFTIYNGNYISNPGWYATNNKYTHSLAWTSEMFLLEAGAKITLKNLKFGSVKQPIYLSSGGAKDINGDVVAGYTVNDTFGIFDDTAGAVVEWNNVNFYVERYGRGLGSFNIGPVITFPKGAHTFTNCSMNTSVMSAGSQYGGWFWVGQNGATFSFTNCVNNGFTIETGYTVTTDEEGNEIKKYGTETGEMWGSVSGGFIHTANGDVYFKNCRNNLTTQQASYGDIGYKFGAFIGEIAKGNLYMEACVNNAKLTLGNITIGGGLVGRGQNGANAKFQIINSVNNGDIKRSGSKAMTENHGFGGIAGHVSANELFEIIGCTNYGDIQGVGNIGGIVGLYEGTASVYTVKDCTNYGNITSVGNVEAGGIVGQARFKSDISNCKNFGAVNTPNRNGGIVGQSWNADYSTTLTNCVNYGEIGNTSTQHAAGMISTTRCAATLTGCINYGKVTTRQYSAGMIAEISAAKSITISSCQNFGEIAGVHAVGGFIGQTANAAGVVVSITNSVNAGTVKQGPAAGEGIGGFFGRIAGTMPTISFTGCINTGTIYGSTKHTAMYGSFGDTCGQFIGLYTAGGASLNYKGTDVADAAVVGGFHDFTATGAKKPNFSNCRAVGTVVIAENAYSLKGWICATNDGTTVTALAQKEYQNANIAVTAAPNNGFYGVNVEISGRIYGANEAGGMTAHLSALKSITGQTFIAGNTAEGEQAAVVATPMLRGYQMATDGSAIRFIASINTINYTNVGFTYSLYVGDDTSVTPAATATQAVETVWYALNAAGKDGTVTTKTAADMGAKYISAITFNNIPKTGVYTFVVTPVATNLDGATVYTGTSYTITVTHGAVTSVAQ